MDMSEEETAVTVFRIAQLPVVEKNGSIYLAVDARLNKRWGLAGGDLLTIGCMKLEKAKPE